MMAAKVYNFVDERIRLRPYASLGLASLEAIVKLALARGDTTAMELAVAEIKRRRKAQELAK